MPTRVRLPVRPILAPLLVLAAALGSGCGKSGQEWAGNVGSAMDKTRAQAARGDMQTLAAAISNHVVSQGGIPDVGDIHELADALQPDFLRRAPLQDPWHRDYDFWTDGSSYVIASAGEDGEWDTADDVEMSDGTMTKMPKGPAQNL